MNAAFESNADGLAWLFGLFCDAVVYSNDGRYSASALWTAERQFRCVKGYRHLPLLKQALHRTLTTATSVAA